MTPEKPHLPEDGSNLGDQPTQPTLPPELDDSEATRLQSSEGRTKAMPPVKDTRLVQHQPLPPSPPLPPARGKGRRLPPPPPPEKPKRTERAPARQTAPMPIYRESAPAPIPAYAVVPQRHSSPLSLPIWSVLLMLFMVCGAVSCLVLAVVGLGGRTPPPLSPQFVVITAAPTETPAITLPALSASATFPAQLAGQSPASGFVLSGPTLPPVVISPTPENIGIGKTVIVDSKESGLNVRSAPGVTTGSSVNFVADDGTTFNVVDGPAQSDGYTWWKIQSPTDPNQTGWAASVFLEIAPK